MRAHPYFFLAPALSFVYSGPFCDESGQTGDNLINVLLCVFDKATYININIHVH